MVVGKVPVDDKSFYVEISERDALMATAVAEKAIPGLDQIMEFKEVEIKENISAIAKSFHDALKPIKPDELMLEFGIKFTGKEGKLIALLAEIGGEVHVDVTATWKSP